MALPKVERQQVFTIPTSGFGSKEEAWVYYALTDFLAKGWIINFWYQVPIIGNPEVRGSQVLDFLVLNPFYTALPVHGDHWHSSQLSPDQALKDAMIRQMYPVTVILWGRELPDPKATYDLCVEWLINRAGSSKE